MRHRRLELQLGKLSFHGHVIDVLDMCVHVKLEKNNCLPSRIEVRPTALPHAPCHGHRRRLAALARRRHDGNLLLKASSKT